MKLLIYLLSTIFCLGIYTKSYSIVQQEKLDLKSKGYTIENTINIQISPASYEQIKKVTGNKIAMKNPVCIINMNDVEVNKIHTRGNTTLHFRRKSYSLQINKKTSFYQKKRKEKLKKFYAISLSMDKYYIRNRLAFGMMEKIGLFHLFYGYAEIAINDNSEGIYMLLERPQDWAIKKKNSPLVIRRGYNQNIDKIKTRKEVGRQDEKIYKNHYKKIYKSLNVYQGKALYDSLSQWLDVELYMKWLAFNYFVKNGDYTDEVYFYIDPTDGKFKIIPWDYDDIFAIAPHEGNAIKKSKLGNKYIYSSEDELDRKIANDPYLYNIYISIFKETLGALSENVIKDIFENTFAELLPYMTKEETLSMAKFDLYKDASIETLSIEMQTLYVLLVQSRNSYLNYLQ